MTVVCPDCKAVIGAPCVNEYTGLELKGFPAHVRRILLAAKKKAEASDA